MGRIVRGAAQSVSFDSERFSKYDSIFRRLLRFDSQGGSIDEDAFVEELCRIHGMKGRPRIVHVEGPGPKGGTVAGEYDPNDRTVYIYDGSNVGICDYAETMAHEIQHASDHEKGLAMEEPIAYREGDEAQYACEKKESTVFLQQENSDARFSSDFGISQCPSSYGSVSCVDVDSDDLDRLKRLLQYSASRLDEIRGDIGKKFAEINTDWRDNKYDEFYLSYRNTCNPKLEEMIEEIRGFVMYLERKIEILRRYQSNRIPFE